jgi:diketogulonate reductase-like aldo/keto reductase
MLALPLALPLLALACAGDRLEIAPGVCMPYASDGDVMKHGQVNDTAAAALWLAAGGRGLDTAWSYDFGGYGHAQRQVGVAIAASGVPREEIFLTTKIPCGASASEVDALVAYDLEQLMLPYVDLLLIHKPTAPACNSSAQVALTWARLQTVLAAGKTRAIGVSNFDGATLAELLAAPTTSVTPAVNQISFHVSGIDRATVAYCASKGIRIEAYSPFGHTGAPVLSMPAVLAVAHELNKSAAQVALRFIVQSGHSFVTASGSTAHDAEDLAVFGFSLSAAQMAALDRVAASTPTDPPPAPPALPLAFSVNASTAEDGGFAGAFTLHYDRANNRTRREWQASRTADSVTTIMLYTQPGCYTSECAVLFSWGDGTGCYGDRANVTMATMWGWLQHDPRTGQSASFVRRDHALSCDVWRRNSRGIYPGSENMTACVDFPGARAEPAVAFGSAEPVYMHWSKPDTKEWQVFNYSGFVLRDTTNPFPAGLFEPPPNCTMR